MFVAFIALAGTLLGSAAAILGAALNERRQARHEQGRWRRDQLGNAYEQALRYLLRAANRRSAVDPALGAGVLNTEHHRDWFDDLAEAQTWLMVLVSQCGSDQEGELRRISGELDLDLGSTPDHGPLHGACDETRCDMRSTARILRDAAAAVAACARADLGPEAAALLLRQTAGTVLREGTVKAATA